MRADQALDIVTNGSYIRSISASQHTPTQHEQPARGDPTADHTHGDAGQRPPQSRDECGGERDQNIGGSFKFSTNSAISSACLRQTGRAVTPPRKWPFTPTINQSIWASMAMEIPYSKMHYSPDLQSSPHNLSFGGTKRGR